VIVPAGYLLRERGEFGGSDLPILTVESEYGVRVRDLEAGGRAVSEDLNGYRRVRPGDLVVNRLWARFGAYGVSEFDGLISPAYWVLKLNPDLVDGRFLHSLLRSSPYLAEIRRLSKDMPPNGYDLPWDLFKRMPITLPALPVQRAIADYLDRETALITKTERMIELLRERRQALTTVAVTGELDVPGMAE
jgi:type I restriction enzyme S subunit